MDRLVYRASNACQAHDGGSLALREDAKAHGHDGGRRTVGDELELDESRVCREPSCNLVCDKMSIGREVRIRGLAACTTLRASISPELGIVATRESVAPSASVPTEKAPNYAFAAKTPAGMDP